jgi:hypothetical protein
MLFKSAPIGFWRFRFDYRGEFAVHHFGGS